MRPAQVRGNQEGKGTVRMWLVVGLGNPGSRYEETPHNLGFEVVRLLATRHKMRWAASRQAQAEVARGEIGDLEVSLMMPLTFMNISGEAVGPYCRYYKIAPEHVLVVSDDVAIPWGRIRLRAGGSAGGHNGLKSLIQHLGTDQFPRIRIGCEPDGWRGDLAAYVLAKLRGEAAELAAHMTEIAADAAEATIKRGIGKAQGKFNGYDAFKLDG